MRSRGRPDFQWPGDRRSPRACRASSQSCGNARRQRHRSRCLHHAPPGRHIAATRDAVRTTSAGQRAEGLLPHLWGSPTVFVLMQPIVSVIVPVFNDHRSLAVLLQALVGQDLPREQFEFLIIDNGSDELIQLPSGCPLKVRVLRENQPGSYAARNRGISEARGDIVAFTDADCVPRHDWLSRAVRQIRAAKQLAMVAGHVEVACQNPTHGGASPWYHLFQWHSVANDLNQHRFVSRFHFAATANLITTRAVFERTGTFNARLFSGGDLEWGQRAWSLGVQQVFADDVVVSHPARADWRSLVAKTRRIAGGHYVMNSRSGRPLRSTVAMTLSIAGASICRSWLDPRLPNVGCRLGVILVELSLRLVQLCEVVRLRLGGRALNC